MNSIRYPPIDNSVKEEIVYSLTDNHTGKVIQHLVLFPLELLDPNPWNPTRYLHNCGLLLERKTTKPIILELFDNNKVRIIDGNHRSYCAKEMGYTHIPALVDNGLYRRRKVFKLLPINND